MAELDADLLERREQEQHLSKRVHRLLALGRAAEMRASVMEYLVQDSRLRLPNVVGRRSNPPRARRSAVPPRSGAERSGRPAPKARGRKMSNESHNVRLTSAASATDDADATSSETAWQTKNVATADVSSTGLLEGGDKVDYDGDAVSLAGDMIEPLRAPNLCRTVRRLHLPEGTSDGGKTAKTNTDSRSDMEHHSNVSSQTHFRAQTPQDPAAKDGAQPAPEEQIPLSPVPPCSGMARPRPPPPHRNRSFWRDGNPQASSGPVQDFKSEAGVNLATFHSSRQQLPAHADDASAEEDCGVHVDLVCADATQPPFARLPPRPSSV
eukprot:TRINITY_DN67881_c0_g1_i1.p1 TRINITY_DN67881_c0_g1~~TRINITY_DN67881_c0_g1_i1.p1  ORF type:complete len:324 (-),score=45.94 TRINITY_DN67881_c0_g1_i1:268-1239(-)